MATTYNDLLTRVPLWLLAQNTALVAQMPTIIEQAEDRLVQVIDHDLFRTVLTGHQIATDGLLDLSGVDPRIFEIRGVRVRWRGHTDGWTPLKVRELEMLNALYPTDRPDRPRSYTEFDGALSLKFFPKPREAMDVEIDANVHPLRLSVGQQTNIMTEQFPRAVERACLHFGALFMKNYEDAAMYEKDMMAALQEAGAQVGRRRRDEVQTRQRETHNMSGA